MNQLYCKIWTMKKMAVTQGKDEANVQRSPAEIIGRKNEQNKLAKEDHNSKSYKANLFKNIWLQQRSITDNKKKRSCSQAYSL